MMLVKTAEASMCQNHVDKCERPGLVIDHTHLEQSHEQQSPLCRHKPLKTVRTEQNAVHKLYQMG